MSVTHFCHPDYPHGHTVIHDYAEPDPEPQMAVSEFHVDAFLPPPDPPRVPWWKRWWR